MKITTRLKRRFLRNILIFLGVCSTGFLTFCAKYGTLASNFLNAKGTIKSKDSSSAISGIQVEVKNSLLGAVGQTDSNGLFSVSCELDNSATSLDLSITDVDGPSNGSYLRKDTIIVLTPGEIASQLKENVNIMLVKSEK
jgi:putative lipoprotein (rSAM/lipoprotein system)